MSGKVLITNDFRYTEDRYYRVGANVTLLEFKGKMRPGTYEDPDYLYSPEDISITFECSSDNTKIVGCDIWVDESTTYPTFKHNLQVSLYFFGEVENCGTYYSINALNPSNLIYLYNCKNIHDCGAMGTYHDCHHIHNVICGDMTLFSNCNYLSNIASPASEVHFLLCEHLTNINAGNDDKEFDSMAFLDCKFVDPNSCSGYIPSRDDGKFQVLSWDGTYKAVSPMEQFKPLIHTTYDTLKHRRDEGDLIPGCFYRIVDYECTSTDPDTTTAGHDFDIVV
jgi:hypothetical protein